MSNQLFLTPDTSTYLDTVALKINHSTKKRNADLFQKLNRYFHQLNYYVDTQYKDNYTKISYIYKNSHLILSIKSGTEGGGKYCSTSYYNKLTFCGLKSYQTEQDNFSDTTLKNVTDYLYENASGYMPCELDIALDIQDIDTNQLFVIKSNAHSSSLNSPLEPYVDNLNQQFPIRTDTYYIENKYRDERGYIYNKSAKEKLLNQIVRFEVKIQKRGFNDLRHMEDIIPFIKKRIQKYRIYYFNDVFMCEVAKKMYIDGGYTQTRELKRFMKNHSERLIFDYKRIEEMLKRYFLNMRNPMTLEDFF